MSFPVENLPSRRIEIEPKLTPTMVGALRYADGSPAPGAVFVELRSDLAQQFEQFTNVELESLGVPFQDAEVAVHRDRVLIPLGDVEAGAITVPPMPLRLMGYPTCKLVLRGALRVAHGDPPSDVIFNLEVTENVATREGTGPGDVLDLGTVVFPRPRSIPALSTWGLAVMVLALLAVGSVVIIQRRPVAA